MVNVQSHLHIITYYFIMLYEWKVGRSYGIVQKYFLEIQNSEILINHGQLKTLIVKAMKSLVL